MDLQAAFDAGFEAVKAYVEREVGALEARIQQAEERTSAALTRLDAQAGARAAAAEQEAERLAREALAAEVAGQAEDLAGALAVVERAASAITALERRLEDAEAALQKAEAAIAAIEPEPGPPGAEGPQGVPGPAGRDGADGVGLASAMIDRDGALVVTMTDGGVKTLGPVVGADGAAGRDGLDGLGFDDISIEHDGLRQFTFRLMQGERVKEFAFTLPVVLYKSVWTEGRDYEAGDAVTWAGSLWIAEAKTAAKPDSGEGWRLAVKRGRDGRAA